MTPRKKIFACGSHISPAKGDQPGLAFGRLFIFISHDLSILSLHLHRGQCSELPNFTGVLSEPCQPLSALKIRQRTAILRDSPHPTAAAFCDLNHGGKMFAVVASGGDFYSTLFSLVFSTFCTKYFRNNKHKNILKVSLNIA